MPEIWHDQFAYTIENGYLRKYNKIKKHIN